MPPLMSPIELLVGMVVVLLFVYRGLPMDLSSEPNLGSWPFNSGTEHARFAHRGMLLLVVAVIAIGAFAS